MKKLLVIAVILLFCSAYARVKLKDPMVITDTLTVTSQVAPDMMTSGMSVLYRTDKGETASQAMEKTAAAVKLHKDICTFSGYTVNPIYRYAEGSQMLDGYSGLLDFSCAFNDIKRYESVVNDIYAMTSSDTSYNVSARAVRWTASEALLSAKRTELKTLALKNVFRSAQNYSKATGHYCVVKDVTLDYSENIPVFKEMTAKSLKAALAVSEPDKTGHTVSVQAKFSIACK